MQEKSVSGSCDSECVLNTVFSDANMSYNYQHKKPNVQIHSISRITNIPIVEAGWNYAERIYVRVKNSNSLVHWTLGTAEVSINAAIETTLPSAVSVFSGPITAIDKLLCKSLDIMEQRVPSIYLPPQVMYWQTKQYVLNSKLVCPVIKRADSMKQFGNSVLASKYTALAADKLDSALDAADKYVDKYLPDAVDQAMHETDGQNIPQMEGPTGKAVHTFQHVDRFSRKLQRRLTRRTLAEAKALKERSQESIHVLLYVAELVATNPKLALEKAQQLWESLSEDEPENQARPATLEQLIVMLTRESARRMVHLINFTRSTVSKLPSTITYTVNLTSTQCMNLVDALIKATHLEGVKNAAVTGATERAHKMSSLVDQLNSFTNIMLERLAFIIAGQPKLISSSRPIRNNNQTTKLQVTLQPPASKVQLRATHRNFHSSSISNGS